MNGQSDALEVEIKFKTQGGDVQAALRKMADEAKGLNAELAKTEEYLRKINGPGLRLDRAANPRPEQRPPHEMPPSPPALADSDPAAVQAIRKMFERKPDHKAPEELPAPRTVTASPANSTPKLQQGERRHLADVETAERIANQQPGRDRALPSAAGRDDTRSPADNPKERQPAPGPKPPDAVSWWRPFIEEAVDKRAPRHEPARPRPADPDAGLADDAVQMLRREVERVKQPVDVKLDVHLNAKSVAEEVAGILRDSIGRMVESITGNVARQARRIEDGILQGKPR